MPLRVAIAFAVLCFSFCPVPNTVCGADWPQLQNGPARLGYSPEPIDNVRQVHRLDETGVDVWEWCGTDCYGTGQKRGVSEEQDYHKLAVHGK